MGRTLKRGTFKLVATDHPDATEKRNGRCYQVLDDDLGYVGTVGTYQQRFERGPKGKRYVTRRWYSERWWAQLAVEPSRWRSKHYEGPGEAAKFLIWRAREEARCKSQAGEASGA